MLLKASNNTNSEHSNVKDELNELLEKKHVTNKNINITKKISVQASY